MRVISNAYGVARTSIAGKEWFLGAASNRRFAGRDNETLARKLAETLNGISALLAHLESKQVLANGREPSFFGLEQGHAAA